MRIFRSFSERAASRQARARALLAALDERGSGPERAEFVGIHSVHPPEADLEAGQRGLFRVGGELRELVPPIDWSEGPYELSDETAFMLNSFLFADALVQPEVPEEAERRIIPRIATIFVDWIERNPQGDHPRSHKYAWYDHPAAARLVHLTHLLGEGTRLGLLEPAQREILAASVIEHADYLLAEENYQHGHNHGMFSDAALKLAADQLSFAPEAESWSTVARERFRQVVEQTIDSAEGVQLEHSPYYQLVVRGALQRFAPAGLLPEPELDSLLERMDEAAAWMTAPDGTLPPIGDTSTGVKPTRAVQRQASELNGLRAFPRSGYCMVREGDSFLIVTAAFHSTGHKHADDLSYCLYEDGRMIVGDAGNPGYDYAGAERRYCVSPNAHSGIGIDSYTWIRDPRGGAGSGLVASGSGEGWYAILAQNPRIAADDRIARRLLLYRPGVALAVIDEVVALPDERVERFLQLSPELSITDADDGATAVERNGERVALLTAPPAVAGSEDSLSAIRGRTAAPMGGLFFPEVGRCEHCTTLVLSRRGGGLLAYQLALGAGASAPASKPNVAGWLSGEAAEVTVAGLPEAAPIEIRLEDGALRLGFTA